MFKELGTPPAPPSIDSISILPVNSKFLNWTSLFKPVWFVGLPLNEPVSIVRATVVFGLIVTDGRRLRSSRFCLITTPVLTLVRAGTYAFTALNSELSKYLINLK